MKIKDNELCPCGSGKKFKSCCKRKLSGIKEVQMMYGEEVISNPNRLNHLLFEKMKKTDYKICFHPDKGKCKKPIKNAHALQNNGVLSILAEDSNAMVTDLFNTVNDGYVIKKVTKNKATTFYGFCEYHDSNLFKDIETIPYSKNIKQNFLYAYRCCSQEYHKTVRRLKSIQNSIKENVSLLLVDSIVESYIYAVLSRDDVEENMNLFYEALLNNKFDTLKSHVFEFNECYDFAVTANFNPTYDLSGQEINNIYSTEKNQRLKPIFITAFPTIDKFYIILSCFDIDYEGLKIYFEQIKQLSTDNLKIFFNNLLPTYSENIVLSPRLWNSWTAFSKRQYETVVRGGIGDFKKLLNLESPFNSYEDIIKAIFIDRGMNDMLEKPKYDLFKK